MRFLDTIRVLKQPSYHQQLLIGIFEPYCHFLNEEIHALAKKQSIIYESPRIPLGLSLKDRVILVTEKNEGDFYIPKVEYLHPVLEAQGDYIFECISKLERDAIFINQWMSTFIYKERPLDDIRKSLPNFLAKLDPMFDASTEEFCYIPPGKEELWEKASYLAKYYLGYKLLL